MKKVAITTWFHFDNYGTVLQAKALHYIIQNNGFECDIVNYIPQGKVEKNILKRGYLSFVSRIQDICAKKFNSEERKALFEDFRKTKLTFSKSCKEDESFIQLNSEYDIFITGSDQIWASVCFNKRYMLDYVESNKIRISYAPSMCVNDYSDEQREQIKGLLKRYNVLSTRERSGSVYLENLLGQKVSTVVDPTFLLKPQEWISIVGDSKLSKDRPYVLVYFLGECDENFRKVYDIAHKRGLEVKIIPVFDKDMQREGCIQEAVGPCEFINLINDADMICTDSFHGMIFSVNFSKQFVIFKRFKEGKNESQNKRIIDFLDAIGLQSLMWGKDDCMINYSTITPHIELLRFSSLEYLCNGLEY